MSFSAETKNELARVISKDDYCNKTELAAIVRLAGSIQIAGYRKLNLKITTELNSVARKVFKLLKQNFGINTTISVNKNQMLKRNNSYVLIVTSEMGSENLLRTLGILAPEDGFFTVNKVPENLLKNEVFPKWEPIFKLQQSERELQKSLLYILCAISYCENKKIDIFSSGKKCNETKD